MPPPIISDFVLLFESLIIYKVPRCGKNLMDYNIPGVVAILKKLFERIIYLFLIRKQTCEQTGASNFGWASYAWLKQLFHLTFLSVKKEQTI